MVGERGEDGAAPAGSSDRDPAGVRVDASSGVARERKTERADQTVKVTGYLRRWLPVTWAFVDREISDIVEDAVGDYLDRLDGEPQGCGQAPSPRPET